MNREINAKKKITERQDPFYASLSMKVYRTTIGENHRYFKILH